jgi:dihydrofolate reductase
MRKVILNVAVSLDGFIEGPNGEYDWCLTDQDYGMTAFMERIDTIFFGRKSYDLMQRVEPGAYPDKKKYVFSKSLKTVAGNYTQINDNYVREVTDIKKQDGKHIWLFGGASLTTSFINEKLLDELVLSVHPLILGEGKPLFSAISSRVLLRLLDTKTFSSGLVQLSYAIE